MSRKSSNSTSRRIRKHLDKLFFSVSALLLGFWAVSVVDSFLYQRSENRALEALERQQAHPDASSATAARAESHSSGLIGRIEIPRLGVSAIVAEGTDESTLRRAVGHVPGTAFPGEPGNVALAGHRDTFFRKLRGITARDTVRLSTPDGQFLYVVDTTLVVKPDREDLLDSTAVPAITLVTCYPFHYIGSAPRRFIVRARQVQKPGETPEMPHPAAVPGSHSDAKQPQTGTKNRASRRSGIS